MKSFTLLIGGILIVSSVVHAGSDGHHKAHVHGISEMTLVLEKNKLDIEFESPADNVVGFEHTASTPEQKRAVEKARDVLSAPQKLFQFSGATCALTHHQVDVSSLLSHEDHDHHEGHHGHEEHDHEEDDHDHDSDKGSHKESHKESHSEIKAEYQFQCKEGGKLKSISVGLLDAFPGIEKLNVKWVADGKQGATRLNKSVKTIDFNK